MMHFYNLVHTQFNTKIHRIRSDNGAEFMFTKFFNDHGIIHECSCVETPQQNARVECKHQHILQITRALLFHSSLPTKFWSDAVQTAVFLINRTPSTVLHNISPYEKLFHVPPDYSMFRVFGCLCYISS